MQGFDEVRAPRHYAGDGTVECKRALASMMSGASMSAAAAYWWGCAFKYIWRWPLKNGVQDIRKCRECLAMLESTVTEDARRSERNVEEQVVPWTMAGTPVMDGGSGK